MMINCLLVRLNIMKILPRFLLSIIYIALLVFPTLFFTQNITDTKAESADDIAKQIDETKKDLEKTDNKLSDIKKTADSISETIKKLSEESGATQAQVN